MRGSVGNARAILFCQSLTNYYVVFGSIHFEVYILVQNCIPRKAVVIVLLIASVSDIKDESTTEDGYASLNSRLETNSNRNSADIKRCFLFKIF